MLRFMSIRTSIVAAALVFAPLLAQANTELTVKSERSTFEVKGMTPVKSDAKPAVNQTIHLTIGARWIQWDDGSNRGVYDFAKHEVFGVDAKAHRLIEESMYAMVSGKDAELDNRMMLGSALEAGKVENNPMAPTMVEHQLSLRHDLHRASGIERKSVEGEQRYVWREKELFAFSTKFVPLPAAERDLYLRYVRYTIGGHPEVFEDLQKLDGIPKWLRYRDPAYGTAVRLEVMESKTTPNAPYVLPKLERAPMKNAGAAAAAAAVEASTPESREAFAAKILTTANAAADSGKHLQAMLGYIERQLMIDGEMPPDFHQRSEAILHDGNVKALMAAVQAISETQARDDVVTLTRLGALAGEKAYVVGIFRANMESQLGNREAAITLFVAALSKNPFITGVWKDLGDNLDTGYDAADTWRCYETARIIAPDHRMLSDIARGEAAMAARYPEYF
jgi:hypothetical protein